MGSAPIKSNTFNPSTRRTQSKEISVSVSFNISEVEKTRDIRVFSICSKLGWRVTELFKRKERMDLKNVFNDFI